MLLFLQLCVFEAGVTEFLKMMGLGFFWFSLWQLAYASEYQRMF